MDWNCTGTSIRCTEELHTELGWEPLARRRKFHRAGMMHKVENGLAPSYLQDLMRNRVQARTLYNLLNTDDRDIPVARISAYSNSFFPAATRQWNELSRGTIVSKIWKVDPIFLCQFHLPNLYPHDGGQFANGLVARWWAYI